MERVYFHFDHLLVYYMEHSAFIFTLIISRLTIWNAFCVYSREAIYDVNISKFALPPLFFLLHLLEGGEGFFHDGVDAGGDLFVGHVYFAAGRRLDAELGYISKWIGDFA